MPSREQSTPKMTDLADSLPQQHNVQIILSPSRLQFTGKVSLLAGTASSSLNWRNVLTTLLAPLPITILNPHRSDWDSSWTEDPFFQPFAEQVAWEQDMQSVADLIVVYLGSETDAPVSLMEFGMAVGRGKKMIVGIERGYRKSGYVVVVCQRGGVEWVDVDAGEDGVKALAAVVKERVEGVLQQRGVGLA